MASSITAEHIKLMKSETLLDTPDGGGRMTTEEIAAGESNNLFPDTSSLDRVYGRLNLRKTFLSVQTQDTDSLMGANVIVAKKPEDPNIDVTLFSTQDWFDRRTGAQNQMEQYVARGTLWAGHLLETQLKGQRSIQIAIRQNDEEPKVDQCLYLVENEGLASEFYQYVRVEKVTSRLRTFTFNGKDIVRKVVTIETTVPLRHTFTGCTVPEYEEGKIPAAKLRDTQVADAARYYGTRPLAAAANIGDRNVLADSVFSQLVPTTQAETVIANHNAAGLKTVSAAAGGRVSLQIMGTWQPATQNRSFLIGVPILKGSLRINKVGSGSVKLFDLDGVLVRDGDYKQVGTIEYSKGLVWMDVYNSSWVMFEFTPAAEVISPTHTDIVQITQDARGYNYVKTLLPKPIAGTLAVSYESLGEVYYLYDNGRGEIKGVSDGIGAGTIDYESGTVTLSTGALPDADSAILFSWQSNADAVVRDVELEFYNVLPLPDDVVSPYGTLFNRYFMSSDKPAQVTAAGITLGGEKIGYYDAQSRCIYLNDKQLNHYGDFSLSWSSSPLLKVRAGSTTYNEKKILPGSVSLAFSDPIEWRKTRTENRGFWGVDFFVDIYSAYAADSIQDDGNGNLLQNGIVVGTVDYVTHAVALDPSKVQLKVVISTYKGINYGTIGEALYQETKTAAFPDISASTLISPFSMVFRQAGDGIQSGTATLSVVRSEARLPSYYEYSLQKPSVIKNGDSAVAITNNSAYINSVTLNYHEESQSFRIDGNNILSATLATTVYYFKTSSRRVSEVHFRAPANPLRAGSVQVMFQHEGKTLSYMADSQGRLTGEHIIGTVDYKTGVVSANFKTKVQTDDGEEVETDLPVDVSTLRFNAVAFRNIPLDAELLGIDPVRLPSDGRVPVFRNGNVVVVHNTQSYRLNAPAAGKVYNVGRTRLSSLKVYDSNGTALNSAMYSCDLDAGTLTLTPSFRADGLQLPLTAEHRIEDMGVVSDVQINGLVSLTTPLTHDYPKEGTMISSALIAGDLQARAYNVFTQRTWSNAWADSSTDVVTAKYDTANFPIQVLNDGATEERWALIFTGTKNFRIVGENSGQIAEGTTDTVTAPVNPITGKPYFSILAGGWGSGWASGMVLRFNTAAANYPVWVARTVLPGHSSHLEDKFCLMVRGDVDR